MIDFDEISLNAADEKARLGLSVERKKQNIDYQAGQRYSKSVAQQITGLSKREIERVMASLEEEGVVFERPNTSYSLTVENLVSIFEKSGVPKHRDTVKKAIVTYIVNLKGGAGKSVAAVNLAQGLRNARDLISKDLRVLVIDLDPQGSATMLMKHELLYKQEPYYTAAQLALNPDCSREDVLKHGIFETDIPNVSVMPASIEDAFIASDWMDICEEELKSYKPYDLLKILISKIERDFDFIFIDSGPHLDAFLLNSLVAADVLAIPCPPTQVELHSTLTFLERLPVLKSKIERKGSSLRVQETLSFMTKFKKTQGTHLSSRKIVKTVIPSSFRTCIPMSEAFDKTASTFDTVLTMRPGDFDGGRATIKSAFEAVCDFADEFYETACSAVVNNQK